MPDRMNQAATPIQQLDDFRKANFARSESRPQARTTPKRRGTDPEVRKARDRLRTASWRAQQDSKRRPEAAVVAMALLKAVCLTESAAVDARSGMIISAAMIDLHERGFSLSETMAVVRRLRKKWQKDKELDVELRD